MSVVFKVSPRQFWEDTRGIVTVQMVIFSVLLFGGVGLMMDFGRAYSAHSQMQGYIDQVALAAAEQLDGQDDAISRATTAAQAVSKSSAFLEGNTAFQLSSLTFMTKAPTDSNGDFSASLASTYNTTDATQATHVLARATTSSVSAKLLSFGSNEADGVSDIDINASAVATRRTVSCGGLSPMVMCNPFETATDTSWAEEMKNGIGYRMKLTANVTDGSKPSNTSTGTDQLRLGLLKSPDSLMDVRNTICTNTSYLPGYGTVAKSTETLKDICMLATVNAGLSCVNDQVAYKAAHPETITTGLGVVFDMYDDSMVEILNPADDFNFAHSFPSSMGFATNISRSSLFYPDAVAHHGRMKREEYMFHLDDEEYYNSVSTKPIFLKAAAQNAINNERAAYGVDLSLDDSSRQNYVFSTGKRTEWGPVQENPCLTAENCVAQQGSSYDVIYNQAPGLNTIKNYASSYYQPHLLQEIAAADPATYPNWWDVDPSIIDANALANNQTTYYGFYNTVERANADLLIETASLGHTGRDAGGDPIINDGATPPNPLQGYGAYGIQAGAMNFPAVYGSSAIGSEERRVQRVTVVNCEAAQTYAAVTGDTSTGFSDTYIGDVVDVIDVLMVDAPRVQGCDPVVSNDPHSNYLCPNEDITEVDLDVELVDAASINSVNFDARFYAVLVH